VNSMEFTGNSVQLGSHIVRKLVESSNLTDEEVLGVARWLLWLQLADRRQTSFKLDGR
jgi:hypothetical protein